VGESSVSKEPDCVDLAERWLGDEGDLSADEITAVCERLLKLEWWRMRRPASDYPSTSSLWKSWANQPLEEKP